jgi:cation diffusion facilitator CzcD-associated flavoprotein CzcO
MGFVGRADLPKACIIGAGCAGFTTAKRLKDHEISYDCFEMSDDIGGNWYFRNPNGRSACYASLHIDTSKWRLAFEDFPVPDHWPDFPHHTLMLQYFSDYVAHFGLRDTITFNTAVTRAHRDADGLWSVTLSTGETRRYDVLFVCNGHHWDPCWPDPYPGAFTGRMIHAHDYRTPFDPIDMRDKNVIVVGAGNSAVDIASELSQRAIARNLWTSWRRGVWVLPKTIAGRPSDKVPAPAWMPLSWQRKLAKSMIVRTVGRMETYGLPTPDHDPLEAHATVSSEFLARVQCGDVKPKPAIKAFDGAKVIFTDDTEVEADVIVFATGYKISFPFFDQPEFQPDAHNRIPLWKRMMKPGVNNLFYMGLAQPLPTLVNFPEQQSKLCAAFLTGRYALPDAAAMAATIAADERLHAGHYYDSPRHTIQLDFNTYCRDLAKEVAVGEKRASAAGAGAPIRPRAAPAAA